MSYATTWQLKVTRLANATLLVKNSFALPQPNAKLGVWHILKHLLPKLAYMLLLPMCDVLSDT